MNKSIKEAYEGVSPDKLAYINKMDDKELKALFPDLTADQTNYLKFLTSPYYDELVKKIERWTGIRLQSQRELPAIVQLTFQSLNEIKEIERNHKEKLEHIALESLLSLDEFKMVKQALDEGLIKFDIKLEDPKREDLQIENDEEVHQMNQQLAEVFEDSDESKLKRRMANMLTQGGAIPKLYQFNMVSEQLEKINTRLPKLYGMLSAVTELGYWFAPFGIELQAAQSDSQRAGTSQVIPDGDTYTIKARGMTFPFLVHEISKGIYEWLAIDDDGALASDTVYDETKDVMTGPALRKKLVDMIPDGKMYLMPLIQKYFLKQSSADMKAIIGGDRAKLNALVTQAESDWDEYNKGA